MSTTHERIVALLRRRCAANSVTLAEFHRRGQAGQLDGELADWWRIFGDDLATWDL